ncbi:MAG: hypothetical protein GF329_14685 [Candidatus Lokiarchaeota archaeon]|nr:hypothetical protein [Candidatus Lokiarchaeota archaeon]
MIDISNQLGESTKAKQFVLIIKDFKRKLGLEVEERPEEVEEKVQDFLSNLMKGPIADKSEETDLEEETEQELVSQDDDILGRLREIEAEAEPIIVDEDESYKQEDTPKIQTETPVGLDNVPRPPKPNVPAPPEPNNIPSVPKPKIPSPPKPKIPSSTQVNNIPKPPKMKTTHDLSNKPISTPPKEVIAPPKSNVPTESSLGAEKVNIPEQTPQIQKPIKQTFNQPQTVTGQTNESNIDILKESEEIFSRLKKLQGLVSEDSESQIKITPVRTNSQEVKRGPISGPKEAPQKPKIPIAEPQVEEEPMFKAPTQPEVQPPQPQVEEEPNLPKNNLPQINIEQETENLRERLSEIRDNLQERESIAISSSTDDDVSVNLDEINIEEISLDEGQEKPTLDEKKEIIEMIRAELPKLPKKKVKYIVKELLKREKGKLRNTWFKVYVHKNKKYR